MTTTKELLITNIGSIATSDPEDHRPLRGTQCGDIRVVPDAAIYARDGVIIAAGPRDEVLPLTDAVGNSPEVIDAGGRLAVPAFVDPHTHLVYEGARAVEYEQRINGAAYLEILAKGGGILNTVAKTRAASADRLYATALDRSRQMACFGTTTIEVKSGYGLDLESEKKQLRVVRRLGEELPLRYASTFLGAHAVPPEFAGLPERFVEYLVTGVLPELACEKLAEFVDVFCEEGVFSGELSRRLLVEAARMGFLPKLHADEMTSSGGAELAASIGAISADHLVSVSPGGIEALAHSDVVAVLLPATSLFMGKTKHAPAREMIDRGVAVALATDHNPGTSPVFSMPLVMSFACSCLRMTPGEALTAATHNAAAAVARSKPLGSIKAGKQADIALMNAIDYRELPYFMGSNLAGMVISGMRVIAQDGRPNF